MQRFFSGLCTLLDGCSVWLPPFYWQVRQLQPHWTHRMSLACSVSHTQETLAIYSVPPFWVMWLKLGLVKHLLRYHYLPVITSIEIKEAMILMSCSQSCGEGDWWLKYWCEYGLDRVPHLACRLASHRHVGNNLPNLLSQKQQSIVLASQQCRLRVRTLVLSLPLVGWQSFHLTAARFIWHQLSLQLDSFVDCANNLTLNSLKCLYAFVLSCKHREPQPCVQEVLLNKQLLF